MKEETPIKEQRKGRTQIGEVRGKEQRKNFSKRAADGQISVEKQTCPFCKHHKAFTNINRSGYKCAKCKRWY